MIKRFWIFIFFLSIFLIFSIPDKSNFNLRFAVASTHYFLIFSSGLILLLFYSYKIGFNAKILQIFLLFFFFIVWLILFSNTNFSCSIWSESLAVSFPILSLLFDNAEIGDKKIRTNIVLDGIKSWVIFTLHYSVPEDKFQTLHNRLVI